MRDEMVVMIRIRRCLQGHLAVACAAAALLGVVPPAAAGAQDGDQQQRAGQLFAEGVEHFEAGEYREALADFEQAYRLAPHHAVRVNMAACFAELDRPVEALFNYERFLEESEGQVKPAQLRQVKAAMAELEQQVGELQLDVQPQDARVHVDDRNPRRLPDGRLVLAEGRYEVEVFAPGYQSQSRTVDIQGGTPSQLQVTLQPAPPAAMAVATPAVGTPESAADPAPPSPAPSRADGAGPWWTRPGARWGFGSSAIVLAVAGVATGVALAVANNDYDAAVRREQTSDDALERRVAQLDQQTYADRADRLTVSTAALLAGAAALGAGSLSLWLVARKHGEGASAALRPWIDPHHAGLALSGRY